MAQLSDVVHRLSAGTCPQCGYKFDSASGVNTDARPEPEDATVCMNCAAWLIYTNDLGVRPITAEEIATLDIETHRALTAAAQAIRRAPGFMALPKR